MNDDIPPEDQSMGSPPDDQFESKSDRARAYWIANVRLTAGLLAVWFAVSFGAGILMRDWLDNFSIGGAPLGFWFAQNGSIYVFIVLIFVYCWAMEKLEHRFSIDEE